MVVERASWVLYCTLCEAQVSVVPSLRAACRALPYARRGSKSADARMYRSPPPTPSLASPRAVIRCAQGPDGVRVISDPPMLQVGGSTAVCCALHAVLRALGSLAALCLALCLPVLCFELETLRQSAPLLLRSSGWLWVCSALLVRHETSPCIWPITFPHPTSHPIPTPGITCCSPSPPACSAGAAHLELPALLRCLLRHCLHCHTPDRCRQDTAASAVQPGRRRSSSSDGGGSSWGAGAAGAADGLAGQPPLVLPCMHAVKHAWLFLLWHDSAQHATSAAQRAAAPTPRGCLTTTAHPPRSPHPHPHPPPPLSLARSRPAPTLPSPLPPLSRRSVASCTRKRGCEASPAAWAPGWRPWPQAARSLGSPTSL